MHSIMVFFVLGLYFLLSYYLYKRLLFFFYIKKSAKRIFTIFYFCFVFSFFIGLLVERFFINLFTEFIIIVGAMFLFLFFYFLIFTILFDILYVFFKRIEVFKRELARGAIIIIFLLFVYGLWNFYNLKIQYLNIYIDKEQFKVDSLNIAYVSDIHLGTFVNESKLNKLINTIIIHKPDILLIGGDLIDNNVEVVKYYDLLKGFERLNLPLGIYMCLGNHEYIGKYFKEKDYILKNNIKILRDTVINIDSLFYLIGRDDLRSKNKRKSLSSLVQDIAFKYPVVLLEHQPLFLDETANYPIDLQLSGHTHHGQIFPINFITQFLYEKDWVFLKKRDTNYYISCGFGAAIFPVRIGSLPEILFIKLIRKEI